MREDIINHIKNSLNDVQAGLKLYARLPHCNKFSLDNFKAGKDLQKLRKETFWAEQLRTFDYNVRQQNPVSSPQASSVLLEDKETADLHEKAVEAIEDCIDEPILIDMKATATNEIGKFHRLLREIGDENSPEKIAERKPLIELILLVEKLIKRIDARIEELRNGVQETANTDLSGLQNKLKLLRTQRAKKQDNVQEWQTKANANPNNEKIAKKLNEYKTQLARVQADIALLEQEISKVKER